MFGRKKKKYTYIMFDGRARDLGINAAQALLLGESVEDLKKEAPTDDYVIVRYEEVDTKDGTELLDPSIVFDTHRSVH